MELSAEMVSKFTHRILPSIKEWQSRPLNPVYPFVFMDCIHYKVREKGRILSHVSAGKHYRNWAQILNQLSVLYVKGSPAFCKRKSRLYLGGRVWAAPHNICILLIPDWHTKIYSV